MTASDKCTNQIKNVLLCRSHPHRTFYLPDWLQWQVAHDKHGFLAAVRAVLAGSGWQMQVRGNGLTERLASVARPGWAMFYEDAPMSGRSLTMRRSYLEPFWHIEKTAKRWEFDVAKAAFDPGGVNGQRAGQFGGFWRTKLELPEARGLSMFPCRANY